MRENIARLETAKQEGRITAAQERELKDQTARVMAQAKLRGQERAAGKQERAAGKAESAEDAALRRILTKYGMPVRASAKAKSR